MRPQSNQISLYLLDQLIHQSNQFKMKSSTSLYFTLSSLLFCFFLVIPINSFLDADSFTEGRVDKRFNQSEKSTEDLSFLIGEWEVERIYSPNSDEPRTLKGTLVCDYSMDNQFIKCTYEMQRPGKIRGLDVVYFNYNSIYELYESMWLSSTWPIKGIMQGQLNKETDSLTFITKGQFPIQDGIMEYVKGSLVAKNLDGNNKSFFRKTYIRTSKDPEGYWFHHMNEMVTQVDN